MTIYKFIDYKNKKIDTKKTYKSRAILDDTNSVKKEFKKPEKVEEKIISSSERLYEIIVPFLQAIDTQQLLPNIFPNKVDFIFYRSNDFLENFFEKIQNISLFGINNKIKKLYNKPIGEVQQRYSHETYEIRLNAEMLTNHYFKYSRYYNSETIDIIRNIYGGEELFVNSIMAHELGHVIFGEMLKGDIYLKANNTESDTNNLVTKIMKNLNEGFADTFSFYLLDRIHPDYYQQKERISIFRKKTKVEDNYNEYYIESIKDIYLIKIFSSEINQDLPILFEVTKQNLKAEIKKLFKTIPNFKKQLEEDFYTIYKQSYIFNSEKDIINFIDINLIPNYTPQEIDTLNDQKAAYTKEYVLDKIKKIQIVGQQDDNPKLKQ